MWELLIAAQKLIATKFYIIKQLMMIPVNNGETAGNQIFTNFPEII